jgi:aconitate hydratase A / 2-methylisocitrate dehydratase
VNVPQDSFGAKAKLSVGDRSFEIYRLDALGDGFAGAARLPYSLKILLENMLRYEDGVNVHAADVEAMAGWDPSAQPSKEITFAPARVLMQDFTGVPAVVDLAVMRDAMADMGGDPAKINPHIPVDLVIDHSIIADVVGRPDAFLRNAELEFERNRERYLFLRWGQAAFGNFRVVPPNTGICHQVNLEYLSQVVWTENGVAYPDTLVGTDSHTPMVNGLGVLAWGVGGIEAEAALLGQPISMLIPRVVGFRLEGEMPEGSTATDLVLTVTQMLRQHGVVGKFVEFYGPGVARVPVENRATIGNMSPEYGSTVTIFPIDEQTLHYLRFTGRPEEQVQLVEAYAKEQGLWHEEDSPEPAFSERLELDLSTVVPSLAGPTRPQDRVPLDQAKEIYRSALAAMLEGQPSSPATEARREVHMMGEGGGSQPASTTSSARKPRMEPDAGRLPDADEKLPFNVRPGTVEEASAESFPASDPPSASDPGGDGGANSFPYPPGSPSRVAPDPPAENGIPVTLEDGTKTWVEHGCVVIAAITSCTNTSNPSVMLGAALLAKNAVERGLEAKPWVKRSLAPGSRVVIDYYERSGLLPYLEKLGFNLVGYGCTTCIGNSGPLLSGVGEAVAEGDLVVASVLSGNRNFEGRINPDCRMNFLASPPLVVAYSIAGSMDWDPYNEPIGDDLDGKPVMLKDIWPSNEEVQAAVRDAVESDMFKKDYADIFKGNNPEWDRLDVPKGQRYKWTEDSTYIRKAPYFVGMPKTPPPRHDIKGARVLVWVGDSVTTDHISPAGSIKKDSPAGKWLIEHGVEPRDFNSYGSRRGNHEVMVRGTFANIRIRNKLVPGVEGGYTMHLPQGDQMTIYDASVLYQEDGVPLIVLAGKEYGSGSSRDWAAKGPRLQGVDAVIAESFERIHRSNLIGMGIWPLQFKEGDNAESLGLTGKEEYAVVGLEEGYGGIPKELRVETDTGKAFKVTVRIDTPKEVEYFKHGGILHYVLRQTLHS